jgi:hypothetical protein
MKEIKLLIVSALIQKRIGPGISSRKLGWNNAANDHLILQLFLSKLDSIDLSHTTWSIKIFDYTMVIFNCLKSAISKSKLFW